MKLLIVISLLFAATGWAACPKDKSGTWVNNPSLGVWPMPNDYYCPACRDLTQFPEDFRNQLWNAATHGGTAAADQIHHIFQGMMDIGPTMGFEDSLSIPVCNRHGQCTTSTALVIFKRVGFTFRDIPLVLNTSVDSLRITTRTPDGGAIVTNYDTEQGRTHLEVKVLYRPDKGNG